MGENGETKPVHPSPTNFVFCPHFPPFPPIFPHFPHFPPFSPIFPHFPPFCPISPHLSWYRVHYGYVAGYLTTHLVQVFLRPVLCCTSCEFLFFLPFPPETAWVGYHHALLLPV